MNYKIALQCILVGLVMIMVLLLFQKLTKVEVPAWLGGIVIVSVITIFSRVSNTRL